MMSTKNRVIVGDIYAIPAKGRFAFGKIIYASEYFQDLILVRFFEKAFTSADEKPEDLSSLPSRGIYTGIDSIKGGDWRKVGFALVSEEERTMSKRIVAGDVWIEDKCLGEASDTDLATLPKMLVLGSRLVEKAVERLP